MEKECARCGKVFKPIKNRRYCDVCDEILDFNINTPFPDIFREKYNEKGKLKSQQIGYFCSEEGRLNYYPTKMSAKYPYNFEYPEDLDSKFYEFSKLLKSRKNSKDDENSKDIGLILKEDVMYRKLLKNGTISLVKLKGDYIYPPPPKKYPIYKTECTICKDIFFTFSNKTKYCHNCRLDMHAEQNRAYKKKYKRVYTPDEQNKMGEDGQFLKTHSLDKPGAYSLGAKRNPNFSKEAEKIRKEMKRLKLK